MESPAELKSILLGHVINGTYFLGALLDSPELPALTGGLNKIAVNGMSKYNLSTPLPFFSITIIVDLQIAHAHFWLLYKQPDKAIVFSSQI